MTANKLTLSALYVAICMHIAVVNLVYGLVILMIQPVVITTSLTADRIAVTALSPSLRVHMDAVK